MKCAIPQFLKNKRHFTLEDDQKTKQVANAHIHTERVISRMKDIGILTRELLMDMYDLAEHS